MFWAQGQALRGEKAVSSQAKGRMRDDAVGVVAEPYAQPDHITRCERWK